MEKLNLKYYDLKFLFIINNTDTSGMGCINEIINNDEYKLYKYKENTNFILDIGGNCGLCTIILALQNPNAKIIVLEPYIECYNLINKNIEINNIKNVLILKKALYINSNINKLQIHENMSGASTLLNYDEAKFVDEYNCHNKIENVNCITFDDLITEYNIEKIYLLKIDCEGGEYSLFNSNKLKLNIIDNMCGEFHYLNFYKKDEIIDINVLYNYCKKYVKYDYNISILQN